MFHIVTQKALNQATEEVRREFKELGIPTPKVKAISSFFLSPVSSWVMAYYVAYLWKESWILKTGRIYVPMFFLDPIDIKAVIRHEFGHGILTQFPELFGWEYDNIFGRKPYLTEYATTDRDEDFCETLMIYVRRRGKPLKTFGLEAKWRFIKQLGFIRQQSLEGPALTPEESSLKSYVQQLRDLLREVHQRCQQLFQRLLGFCK